MGSASTGSLFGRADGGDGGKGGDGVFCGAYLDASGNVSAEGGTGGKGGSTTSGVFGSSGSDGKTGEAGVGVNAANPRQTED
ncbi:MAG: hypothetical protein IJV72_03830 [Clostridia bacterium]|nr:hypothetical protein [Clostridia bacterium]